MTSDAETLDQERADLLEALGTHRYFLRHTVRGLTDEQAAQRTTASELCLGGLIKHVALVERRWLRFVQEGPSAMTFDRNVQQTWTEGFQMLPGDTLAGLLADYDEVARETEQVLRTVDLNLSHPLPPAPWFKPGATRSARRVFLHVIAETAQHAGHADIIRESLDGQKTMG